MGSCEYPFLAGLYHRSVIADSHIFEEHEMIISDKYVGEWVEGPGIETSSPGYGTICPNSAVVRI